MPRQQTMIKPKKVIAELCFLGEFTSTSRPSCCQCWGFYRNAVHTLSALWEFLDLNKKCDLFQIPLVFSVVQKTKHADGHWLIRTKDSGPIVDSSFRRDQWRSY